MGHDEITDRTVGQSLPGRFMGPGQEFDQHYDVVVVGYGFAGAVAASSAPLAGTRSRPVWRRHKD